MKYLIVSQPKAGTYLCANLLQELGLQNSFLHIFPNRYIRRNESIWNSAGFNDAPVVESDLKTGLAIVPDNTFALTHVSPNHFNSKELAKDFKKILVTRDYNDILDSSERFKHLHDVDIKNLNQRKMENIEMWKKENNVFHITFDDLIKKNLELIDRLQEFIFNSIVVDSNTAISNALQNDSPTKSSIRD